MILVCNKDMYMPYFNKIKGTNVKFFFVCLFDSDEIENTSAVKKTLMQNKLINVSEDVLSCTVHPFNGTIIAGTKVLFTIS